MTEFKCIDCERIVEEDEPYHDGLCPQCTHRLKTLKARQKFDDMDCPGCTAARHGVDCDGCDVYSELARAKDELEEAQCEAKRYKGRWELAEERIRELEAND